MEKLRLISFAVSCLLAACFDDGSETSTIEQGLPSADDEVICQGQPYYESCCVPPSYGGCTVGIRPVQYCCSYGDEGLTWCGELRGICRPWPL